jgi:predicted DNA-binding transcriptional regulator YafY
MKVKIVYDNWKGEVKIRRITPKKIWFGSTEWHPQEQWILDAFDEDKQADRSFAMADIIEWRTQ